MQHGTPPHIHLTILIRSKTMSLQIKENNLTFDHDAHEGKHVPLIQMKATTLRFTSTSTKNKPYGLKQKVLITSINYHNFKNTDFVNAVTESQTASARNVYKHRNVTNQILVCKDQMKNLQIYCNAKWHYKQKLFCIPNFPQRRTVCKLTLACCGQLTHNEVSHQKHSPMVRKAASQWEMRHHLLLKVQLPLCTTDLASLHKWKVTHYTIPTSSLLAKNATLLNIE